MGNGRDEVIAGFVFTWFDNSPNAGDPLCTCSVCSRRISEEEAPVIRIWKDRIWEARFHEKCFLILVKATVLCVEVDGKGSVAGDDVNGVM